MHNLFKKFNALLPSSVCTKTSDKVIIIALEREIVSNKGGYGAQVIANSIHISEARLLASSVARISCCVHLCLHCRD